jgi:hypothetical protein
MKEYVFSKRLQQKWEEEERLRIPLAQGLPWTTEEPAVCPTICLSSQGIDSVITELSLALISWTIVNFYFCVLQVPPKPPVKEQTKPEGFKLITDLRAVERAEFDDYVRVVNIPDCPLSIDP